MCGRFSAASPPSVVAEYFEAELLVDPEAEPHWNVAPSMDSPVVTLSAERNRVLEPYRWGLVPYWADNPSIGSKLINARAETITTARAFRSALLRRRCIVPVDGFYEWQDKADGARSGRDGSRRSGPAGGRAAGRGGAAQRSAGRGGAAQRSAARQPYFARLAGGGVMALAGLWERWRDAGGEWLRSFTIVTTSANEDLAPVHARMPVVLPAERWGDWLDPERADVAAAAALLVPAAAGLLDVYPVSAAVNSPRNDGPELVEREGPGPREGAGEGPAGEPG